MQFLKNASIVALLIIASCCLLPGVQAASTATFRSSTKSTLAEKIEMTTAKAQTNTSISEELVVENAAADGTSTAIVDAGAQELKEAGSEADPLDFWTTMVRGLWSWIRDGMSESIWGKNTEVGSRTFGAIRRLQLALIPIIFKFGVLTAMVAFLVMLGMKTIFLLKVLLLMNALSLMAKLLTLKWNVGHTEPNPIVIQKPAPNWGGYAGWHSAPVAYHGGWSAEPPSAPHHPSKEIHLHIHGANATPKVFSHSGHASGGPHNGWDHRNDPYGAYESSPNELKQDLDLNKEIDNSSPFLPIQYAAKY